MKTFFKKNIFYATAVILSVTIFCTAVFYSDEELVDCVRVENGGLVSGRTGAPFYLNKNRSIFYSRIKLLPTVGKTQTVNRYMRISGFASPDNNKSGFFRSVTATLFYNNGTSGTLSIPINQFGFFSGYIYFTQRGKTKINLYLPGSTALKNNKKDFLFTTSAEVSFYCNVDNCIPEELTPFTPTKNVNSGNKKIKKIAKMIALSSKTDYEKARNTYEYIVRLGTERKLKFKKYKSNSQYHNMFIASDILENKSGICNDFSELYAAILRAECVRVKKIWGYYDRIKSIGHQWNIVYCSEHQKWFRVDPSWAVFDSKNSKLYAEFYEDFDEVFFENAFGPANHKSFIYDRHIEY